MSAQLWPTQDPDPGPAVHLTLQVHRISERSGWKWQLVDTRGLVFETGLPYASSMEARRAAYERLAELTPLVEEPMPSPDARKPGTRIPSPPRTTDQPYAESA
jgi:hypothetical protein